MIFVRRNKMFKKLLWIPILLLLTSCIKTPFEQNKEITEYAETIYFKKLIVEKVKFLKCYKEKDGTMKATYTVFLRDNSFPAIIRFDYVGNSYNIYFDEAYLNGQKQDLIRDIDLCIIAWEQLKDAKQTWK